MSEDHVVSAYARFQIGIAVLAVALGVVAAVDGAWITVIAMVLVVVASVGFARTAMRQQANDRAARSGKDPSGSVPCGPLEDTKAGST